MLQPDRQRLEHIRDYCIEIKKTIIRYGESFEAFDSDADYQRSVSFCILQIGELSGGLSVEFRKATADRIQWGPIKGMRNLVAHSYGSMSRISFGKLLSQIFQSFRSSVSNSSWRRIRSKSGQTLKQGRFV